MIIKHTCLFFSQKNTHATQLPPHQKIYKTSIFLSTTGSVPRVQPTNLPRQYPPSNPYGPPPGGGQGIEFQIRFCKKVRFLFFWHIPNNMDGVVYLDTCQDGWTSWIFVFKR